MASTKDLLIYEGGDGGELAVLDNDIALGERLLQQVYLCFFGGNVDADTRGDEKPGQVRFDWWGNSLFFNDRKEKQFNSQTERALNRNALNSAGRLAIERAAIADLSSLQAIADITVNVTLPGTNKVQIAVLLKQPDNLQGEQLVILWDNAKKEVIMNYSI